MDSDFRILNPPKAPYWRNERQRIVHQTRGILVGLVSLLCAGISLIPPKTGYSEPISFQIARGEPLAWMVFGLMAATILSAIPGLVRGRHMVSLLLCAGVLIGLGVLACTDPRSNLHLGFFCMLAINLIAWIWGLWGDSRDKGLFICALLASCAIVACPLSFGIGERIIILGGLGALYRIHALVLVK